MSRHRSSVRRTPRAATPAILAGVTVAASALAVASVALLADRPASSSGSSVPIGRQQTSTSSTGASLDDPDAADAFRAGAASDISAVTSYDYRRLDDAITAGLAVTTGPFRRAYAKALRGETGSVARRDRLVQTFDLQQTGIGDVADDGRSATVLIFGVQTLSSEGGADDRTRAVTLTATVVRAGDRYLISELVDGGSGGLPPGSTGLRAAAEATRAEVVNLYSFRHDHFDADVQRALAGSREPLTSVIRRNAPGTRAALTADSADLAGAVSALAVVSVDVGAVEFLVGARVTRSGGSSDPSTPRLTVRAIRVGDTWFVDQVDELEGG